MSRLIVSLLLITLAAIIASGWVIDSAFLHYTEKTQSQYQSTDAHYAKALANTVNISSDPENFINQWNLGNSFPVTLLDFSDLVLPDALEETLLRTGSITLQSDQGVSIYYLIPNHQRILAISRPDFSTEPSTTQWFFTLAFYCSIFLILMLWLTPLLLDLKRLRIGAHAFGLGDLKHRISLSRWSHTQDIHAAFNTMADKIERLLNDNKLLSNALSHELKTPLARLRFGFDVLSEEEEPAKKQEYTHRINDDLNEMQSIINALLDYARLDSSENSSKETSVDLQAIIHDCIHAHWLESKQIDVHNIHSHVIQCDPKHIRLLLSNLIKNALLYSTSQLSIRTEVSDGLFRLFVEDDGKGIAESEYETIFLPFTRGEKTVGRGGHGMGLAIVKRVAEWNKWVVSVGRSPSLGGARFCLEIPLQR